MHFIPFPPSLTLNPFFVTLCLATFALLTFSFLRRLTKLPLFLSSFNAFSARYGSPKRQLQFYRYLPGLLCHVHVFVFAGADLLLSLLFCAIYLHFWEFWFRWISHTDLFLSTFPKHSFFASLTLQHAGHSDVSKTIEYNTEHTVSLAAFMCHHVRTPCWGLLLFFATVAGRCIGKYQHCKENSR